MEKSWMKSLIESVSKDQLKTVQHYRYTDHGRKFYSNILHGPSYAWRELIIFEISGTELIIEPPWKVSPLYTKEEPYSSWRVVDKAWIWQLAWIRAQKRRSREEMLIVAGDPFRRPWFE